MPKDMDTSEPDERAALEQIVALCDRFESAWRAGAPEPIESLLELVPERVRERLALELIAHELEFRAAVASPVVLQEYRARFPWIRTPLETDAVFRPPPSGPGGPPRAFGRFVAVEAIGQGGMGQVFRVYDPDLDRHVAVKVMRAELVGHPLLRRRFQEEAHVTARLQHPGLPAVHERGELPDGRPFYAMRLVKGRTFAALLAARADRADDRPRFLAIFEQVAQTLAYAHSKRVIHRDLKPSNVMVGRFGEVQVMDWGATKMLGAVEPAPADVDPRETHVLTSGRDDDPNHHTQPGSVVGTYPYMPPEQAAGFIEEVDERVDVFALGSILCEVLTGDPAYTGQSSNELRRKALSGHLDDAQARLAASGAEADLVALAERCLARDPADRPRDAGEVARAVAEHLADAEARLRAAELGRVEAQARAEEEAKRRILADRLAGQERARRRATAAFALATFALVASIAVGSAAWYGDRRAQAEQRREERRKAEEKRSRESQEEQRLADEARRLADEKRREELKRFESAITVVETLCADAEARNDKVQPWPEIRLRFDRVSELTRVLSDPTASGRVETLEDRIDVSQSRSDRLDQLVVDLRTVRARGITRDQAPRILDADRDFLQVFRLFESDLPWSSANALAERVPPSWHAARTELAEGLTAWAILLSSGHGDGLGPSVRELMEHASSLDPDPLRRDIRRHYALGDVAALTQIANTRLNDPSVPIPSRVLLASMVAWVDANRLDLSSLEKAVAEDPGNFALNLALGHLFLTRQGAPQADLRLALPYLGPAVALNPQSLAARIDLGMALRLLGDVERSLVHLRKAVELAPNDCFTHDQLKESLLELGRYDENLTLFETCLSRNWTQAWAHGHVAEALFALERYGDAIPYTRNAIHLETNDPYYRIQLGEALVHVGELSEARSEFELAGSVRPDDAHALAFRSLVLDRLGLRDESVHAAIDAARVRPLAPHSKSNVTESLATALEKLALSDRLQTAVLDRLRPDRSRPETALLIGTILPETPQNAGEIVDTLRTAVAGAEQDPALHLKYARSLARVGQVAEALAILDARARRADASIDALQSLTDVLVESGSAESTLAELATFPEPARSAVYYAEVAWLSDRLNRPEEAQAAVQKALEIDSDLAQRFHDQGHAFEKLGNDRSAELAFTTSMLLKPLTSPYFCLTTVLRRGRRLDEVPAIYQEILDSGRVAPASVASYERRRDEARRLAVIAPRLQTLADKSEQPEQFDDLRLLADYAYDQRRFAEATSLWTRYFAGRGPTPPVGSTIDLYNAACAAVLADSADPAHQRPPGDRYRDSAHRWLAQHLNATLGDLNDAAQASRDAALRKLNRAVADPDLSSIRTPAGLAGLPAPERGRWRAYWGCVRGARTAKMPVLNLPRPYLIH